MVDGSGGINADLEYLALNGLQKVLVGAIWIWSNLAYICINCFLISGFKLFYLLKQL